MTPVPINPVAWMLDVRRRTLEWVSRQPPQAETETYARLMFAFGLARSGADADAKSELEAAASRLATLDDAHVGLASSFRYRIEEALAGRTHVGPLPGSEAVPDGVQPLAQYLMDRLRAESRILDPDRSTVVYRNWGQSVVGLDAFERLLRELPRATQPPQRGEVIDRLTGLAASADQRHRLWGTILRLKPLVEDAITVEALNGFRFSEPGEVRDDHEATEQILTLESALRLASIRGQFPHLHRLLDLAKRWCTWEAGFAACRLAGLIGTAVEAMGEHRLAEEADCFLNEVSVMRSGGPSTDHERLQRLHSLLAIADGWFRFGWDRLTVPVFTEAEAALFTGELGPREASELAAAVAWAVRSAPLATADACFRKLFAGLPLIHDTYTAQTHYGVSVLKVVEAVCLSAVEVAGHIRHE